MQNGIKGRIDRAHTRMRMRRILDGGKIRLEKVGSDYGGWTLPATSVGSGKIAVCVGAGEDISLDVELNKRGITVYTLDPTPRAKLHVEAVLNAAGGGGQAPAVGSSKETYDLRGFEMRRFHFVDVGLWNEDTTMRFFAPKDPRHVSHSLVNLQHTDSWFEARCTTLKTFCHSVNLQHIDIFKLDVEGAEYTVIEDVISSGIRPQVLCVEFDEGNSPQDSAAGTRIVDTIQMLKTAGYKFLNCDHWNCLFVLATV